LLFSDKVSAIMITMLVEAGGGYMPICYGESLVGTSGINGDMFYISPDKTTLVLSDGASGAGKMGKVVMSECCVRNIKESPFCLSNLSAKEYIENMVWRINNELIYISQKSKTLTFGTLDICVIDNNVATIATIGDSPAYIIHDNTVKRVAKPVKRYKTIVDFGLLTEEQIEEYIGRLPDCMWSLFDIFIPMVVPAYAVEEIEMKDGDIVVMCSDGVSDYVKPEELMEIVNSDNLEESVKYIVNLAKDRSISERNKVQYDDITIVIYKHQIKI